MFTQKDKIKESIEYFVNLPDTECTIYENKSFKPIGVAHVMTYRYIIKNLIVSYNKWFVECFDLAKKMGLDGTERHNKLVKGTGVDVISEKSVPPITFYGKDAENIIDACEYQRDIESCIISQNHNQK